MDGLERPTSSRPPRPRRRPSLLTAADIRAEVERMFDAGPEMNVIVRVHGEDDGWSADAQATFREMLRSLSMYGSEGKDFGAELVAPPTRAAIASALTVLSREAHQRQVLDKALTTFGRRLIDPLGEIIERPGDGSLLPRLTMLRDLFVSQVKELRLSTESQRILTEDLAKLLNDDYLALIGEHEDQVQRPRARQLAQKMLRLVGQSFFRAFQGWPAHAEQVATSIARRMPKRVRLREVPALMKTQITAAIEEFLWVETSTEILGALAPLLAEHAGIAAAAPAELDKSAYRELAEACFGVVAEHC